MVNFAPKDKGLVKKTCPAGTFLPYCVFFRKKIGLTKLLIKLKKDRIFNE